MALPAEAPAPAVAAATHDKPKGIRTVRLQDRSIAPAKALEDPLKGTSMLFSRFRDPPAHAEGLCTEALLCFHVFKRYIF